VMLMPIVPAYSGGWGRRIIWAQELDISLGNTVRPHLPQKKKIKLPSYSNQKQYGTAKKTTYPRQWYRTESPEIQTESIFDKCNQVDTMGKGDLQ
jgi:hypothetical protein